MSIIDDVVQQLRGNRVAETVFSAIGLFADVDTIVRELIAEKYDPRVNFDGAVRVWNVCLAACPNPSVLNYELLDTLLYPHVAELCERAWNDDSLVPATDAEIISFLSGLSLQTPTVAVGEGVFLYLLRKIGLGEELDAAASRIRLDASDFEPDAQKTLNVEEYISHIEAQVFPGAIEDGYQRLRMRLKSTGRKLPKNLHVPQGWRITQLPLNW